MKIAEITKQGDADLATALTDTEKHLFQLRFQSATDRLETPSEIRKAKRTIARIKTVQRQRELVRLKALPDADLQQQADLLLPRTELPGKRMAKRRLTRVLTLQADRAAAKAKTTATTPTAGAATKTSTTGSGK